METHVALKKYFDRKKKSSTGFSVRSVAKRLNVSASFLSRILNGKKSIPDGLLPKLAHALDIEPEFFAAHRKGSRPTKRVANAYSDWVVSELQAAHVLRNWYNIPILELVTLNNFDGDPNTISRRLNISRATTEVALRQLQSAGLLEMKDGRILKRNAKLRIASSKSLPQIRKFHDEMLEKSQALLRNATSEEEFKRRLITGITVSADPEKIEQAKKKIADFLYELANELIESPGTEVYHLAAQLFPLTTG